MGTLIEIDTCLDTWSVCTTFTWFRISGPVRLGLLRWVNSPLMPQSDGKVTFRMNWPIRSLTRYRNSFKIEDDAIRWSSSHLFISNMFHGTQINFSPLNDHKIKELSWVVTMVAGHAQYWHVAVTCPVTVTTVKAIVIASYLPRLATQNQFSGLCNIHEWWKQHRSHTVARFWRTFVCYVIYLPISPQGRPRNELSFQSNLQQPVEFKIVLTEKWIRTHRPVEFAQ